MGHHLDASPSAPQLIGAQYSTFRTRLCRLRVRSSAARVHDTRVAARQLRSTLAALASVLPDRAAHRLRLDLKKIAEELGSSRDARVRGSAVANAARQAPNRQLLTRCLRTQLTLRHATWQTRHLA